MSNYYVNDRKLVGNGSNEECILTQYNNSSSNLSSCLNVGTSIEQSTISTYKVNTNPLSFYTTNFNYLKCNLSSGYTYTTSGIPRDLTNIALMSYRIHNNHLSASFSTNGANKLNVLLIGGGGGGSGTTRSNNVNQLGKGGGGAGAISFFTVNNLTSNNYTIKIGRGGRGGLNGDNENTNNRSFDGQYSQFIYGNTQAVVDGGYRSKDSDAGNGGTITYSQDIMAVQLPSNYTQIATQIEKIGTNGQSLSSGSGWGGRGGTFDTNIISGFPSPISTHAVPQNTSVSESSLLAQNNFGYNNQTTDGFGIGGGGAGGSNHGGSEYLKGADGGQGLGIVFFRYD